jgi:hypothetical protein
MRAFSLGSGASSVRRSLRPSPLTSPGAAPHDASPPYLAVAPLPAAPAAAGSEEEDVVAPLRRRCSRQADASARTSAIVPRRSPGFAAAGRTTSEVVVIDDDDDDDPHSSPGAVPRHSLPAPHAGRASVSHHPVPLWLLADTPLPALNSRGPAEVGEWFSVAAGPSRRGEVCACPATSALRSRRRTHW